MKPTKQSRTNAKERQEVHLIKSKCRKTVIENRKKGMRGREKKHGQKKRQQS